jgi:Xaa-Pro dipeptidase
MSAGASDTERDAGVAPPPPADVIPITREEREARIEKARRLMTDHGLDAIYMEGGSSMFYYTGMRWGSSERMFALIIPARGDVAWVCPAFEEERARELITFGTDIRTWEEDESPYERVAQILADRQPRSKKIGIEERVRFFLADGIQQATNGYTLVNATPVTAGCRMIKSPAELALMQRANDITIEAYKDAFQKLKEGMTQYEFGSIIRSSFRAAGASGGAMVSFGESTAFPHGSRKPQACKEGDMVLVDGGCKVEGYSSDITRTFIFGTPSQRQKDIWELERRSQEAGFSVVKPGVACEEVDAAARKVIVDAGFGPGYAVPGLPHRTGHGIGLDGHEWEYLVKGNKTPMQPGMCFSDEPTISIYGEFGVRLEDVFYVTEDGGKFFTKLSPAIDQPFG